MLAEYAWASFNIWDRTQRGVFLKDTFEATAGPLLATVLRTPRGVKWWNRAKLAGLIPAYFPDVDAMLAGRAQAA